MKPIHLLQLTVLAAIWGSSFLFLRISVPSFGPAVLADLRVGLAALFLLLISRYLGKATHFNKHWRYFLIIGCTNTAIPFLLFSYAAQNLPASILAVLNGTTPVWSVLIDALWTRQIPGKKVIAGLLLGVSGIAVLMGYEPALHHVEAFLAAGAALLAACLYSIAALYARNAQRAVEPIASTHGSLWVATLALIPAIFFVPLRTTPPPEALLATLALGILCTGIAYLLYFRLIKEIGATSTLTVTFLIPAFGILWGHLFLAEAIGWNTIVGSTMIIVAVIFVTGFRVKDLYSPMQR